VYRNTRLSSVVRGSVKSNSVACGMWRVACGLWRVAGSGSVEGDSVEGDSVKGGSVEGGSEASIEQGLLPYR